MGFHRHFSLERDSKIQAIVTILHQQGVPHNFIVLENISAALQSNYANGDVKKTLELLSHFFSSLEGKITPITTLDIFSIPKYNRILGAENRNGVTCYLDTLMFAMFARLESFEPMLNGDNKGGDKENLAAMMRLYINMLRSGCIVTTDITKALLGAIIKAGWDESCISQQQDCCDLFTFITDKLEMPMMTLKLDIEHEGKEDATDDHKLVNERLLLVSVPETENTDEPILLEDCLEQYFANSIQVSRQIERRKNFSISSLSSKSISESRSAADILTHKFSLHVHSPSFSRFSTFKSRDTDVLFGQEVLVIEGEDLTTVISHDQQSAESKLSPVQPTMIPTNSSDLLPEYNTVTNNDIHSASEKSRLSNPSNQLWNKKKEISIPAWMFLQLIPFYTSTNSNDISKNRLSEPMATIEFAEKRPVLGICLKRSEWNTGHTKLNTQHVVVPPVIHFPSFVVDEDHENGNDHTLGTGTEKYVLVLESAIFHRGTSTDSGHFVALAKENNDIGYHDDKAFQRSCDKIQKGDNKLECHRKDYKNTRWVFFDDLKPVNQKVTSVEYEDVFQTEKPYILFYRLVTFEDYENESERHKITCDSFETSENTETSNSFKLLSSKKRLANQDSNISSLTTTIDGLQILDETPRTSIEALKPGPAPVSKGKTHHRLIRLRHHKHRFMAPYDYRNEKCIIS